MPDGFALLAEDHRALSRLFLRYDEDGDDATAREVCDELTVHAEAEEQILYPLVGVLVSGGAELAERAVLEHRAAAELMERVRDGLYAEDVGPVMDALRYEFEHHVLFEESHLFPKLRSAGIDAARFARDLQAAKGEARSRSSGQVG